MVSVLWVVAALAGGPGGAPEPEPVPREPAPFEGLELPVGVDPLPLVDLSRPPVQPWQPDWARRDREASVVARVGGALAIAGPLMMLMAPRTLEEGELPTLTPAGERMALAGQWSMIVGTPMLAGGGLRARRALNEQGRPVHGRAGGLAWGMQGATLASGILGVAAVQAGREDLALLPVMLLPACYLTGVVSGFVQLGNNRRARRGQHRRR